MDRTLPQANKRELQRTTTMMTRRDRAALAAGDTPASPSASPDEEAVPEASTLNPQPSTLNLQSSTLESQLSILNSLPSTLIPEP